MAEKENINQRLNFYRDCIIDDIEDMLIPGLDKIKITGQVEYYFDRLEEYTEELNYFHNLKKETKENVITVNFRRN
jgi:predicted ATPase